MLFSKTVINYSFNTKAQHKRKLKRFKQQITDNKTSENLQFTHYYDLSQSNRINQTTTLSLIFDSLGHSGYKKTTAKRGGKTQTTTTKQERDKEEKEKHRGKNQSAQSNDLTDTHTKKKRLKREKKKRERAKVLPI